MPFLLLRLFVSHKAHLQAVSRSKTIICHTLIPSSQTPAILTTGIPTPVTASDLWSRGSPEGNKAGDRSILPVWIASARCASQGREGGHPQTLQPQGFHSQPVHPQAFRALPIHVPLTPPPQSPNDPPSGSSLIAPVLFTLKGKKGIRGLFVLGRSCRGRPPPDA